MMAGQEIGRRKGGRPIGGAVRPRRCVASEARALDQIKSLTRV